MDCTVLQAIQAAVLLAIAVLIGIFCTPVVGLRSHLIEYWVLHLSNPISWINHVKWGLGGFLIAVVWHQD